MGLCVIMWIPVAGMGTDHISAVVSWLENCITRLGKWLRFQIAS
jgi:hypothetical protein